MIEEIRSMARCYTEDFGYVPNYLIIGQNQFNRFALEFNKRYGRLFKAESSNILGKIGMFDDLIVIIVTSDILEVV